LPSDNLHEGDDRPIVSGCFTTDLERSLVDRINRFIYALTMTEAMFDLECEENSYLRRPWWRKL
jgi:hypothetical protein